MRCRKEHVAGREATSSQPTGRQTKSEAHRADSRKLGRSRKALGELVISGLTSFSSVNSEAAGRPKCVLRTRCLRTASCAFATL